MSQVIGSQKFHSLEVVDSAKFDNEIVFEDLTMDGGDMTIMCSGTFSVVSLVTDTTSPIVDFVGISMTAAEQVVISSSGKDVDILAGIDDTTDVDGVVVLGHQDSAGVTVAHVSAGFVGGVDVLGFYGTAPIAKQTGVTVDAAGIHAALVALGLIAA